MSLIREALDRARRESATPPPRLPGGPIPWSQPPLRRPSRAWAVAAVLAAAALGAGAAWWLRSANDAQTVHLRTFTPPLELPADSPTSVAQKVPADSQAVAKSQAVPSPPLAAVAPKVPADSPTPQIPGDSPPPAAVVAAPAPGRGAVTRYVGSIPLPEGGSLSLDGLISSATNPVAVINGRLLSPGDIVQGFEVLSIGDTQVELGRDGRRFTLALR